MYQSVLLVGGNACFPNMALRLERELRALAPTELAPLVRVRVPHAPISCAWEGAHALSR
jgi:actin-related protein